MIVKRTFSTKLDPIQSFGLSNEILRPRGFQLGAGNPPRSQTWTRGGAPGKVSSNLKSAHTSIELEIDRTRVNFTATADVSEAKAAAAGRVFSGLAQALELLLGAGGSPAAAAEMARRAERGGGGAGSKRSPLVAVCVIILAVLGGGAFLAMDKNPPAPVRWVMTQVSGLTKSQADGSSSKPKKTPPVVIVRKAGVDAK